MAASIPSSLPPSNLILLLNVCYRFNSIFPPESEPGFSFFFQKKPKDFFFQKNREGQKKSKELLCKHAHKLAAPPPRLKNNPSSMFHSKGKSNQIQHQMQKQSRSMFHSKTIQAHMVGFLFLSSLPRSNTRSKCLTCRGWWPS